MTWSRRRISEAVTVVNGYPFDSNGFCSDKGVRLVRIRDLTDDSDVTRYSGPDEHRAPINDGDLLVGMDGDFNVRFWRGGRAVLNQRLCCLRAKGGADIRFLAYLLPTHLKLINDLTYCTTVKHLSSGQVRHIRFEAPDVREQAAIADYLDRKTGMIDELIRKKERLIELLEEKRQALITQAVTKGLDPSGPIKDSEVDGIGQIPAHWTLGRLRWLARVQSGVTKGRKLEGDLVRVPYLRVANVQDGYIDLSDVAEIEVLAKEVARYSLRYGDVLMNEGGDNDKLGRGAVWRGELVPCLHQNHVFALRPKCPALSDWIALSMQGQCLKFFFLSRAVQSTNLASISQFSLKEARLPVPPSEEMAAIVVEVGRQQEKLRLAIDAISRHIGKLYEYRQALISAAVTGKLEAAPSGAA